MSESIPFIYRLADEENDLLRAAEKDYGAFWQNAMEYNGLLNNFFSEVKPEAMFFVMFMSQVRKHHTLALLAIARQHHVQANMNFRQAIEATSSAVYGLAHHEKEDFVVDRPDGTIDDVDPRTKYRWLEENFKSHSDFLKKQKDNINDGPAHSSTTYAFLNFDFDKKVGFKTPFFDKEDPFLTRMNLWFAGNLAMGIMDLVAIANQKYNLITLIPDFVRQQANLEAENHKLKSELGKDKRAKKWLPKVSTPSATV